METEEIFRYDDPREILIHIYQDKKALNPRFSIRAWARKLDFKNPSYLSEVLRGVRKLKPELAHKITETLDISEEGKRYFEALVYYANASSSFEKNFYQSVLRKFNPKEKVEEVEPSTVAKHFKDWIYFVLDEMPLLKDFREDPHYIAKRLGPDVTPQMVSVAIKDLVEKIGTLKRDSKGKLKRKYMVALPVTDAEKILYFNQIRKKIWERKGQAFIEQPAEETLFRIDPIPIRIKDIPKIRKALFEFALKFRNFEAKEEEADEIFALDINFFKITLGAPEPKK